jgi:hypothetical protein
MHLLLSKFLKGFDAIAGSHYAVSLAPEDDGEQIALVGMIFDYQDAQ